jgi:hypothetical protein
MKLRHIFLACLITCLLASSILSQDFRKWEPEDGVAIRQGHHIEWNGNWSQNIETISSYRVEGELAGETGFVWSDCRFGARGIFMQVFDREGEPKFEPGGIHVAGGSGKSIDPTITSCIDGGWFVAWCDFTADTLGDVRCEKVNRDGELIWGENNRGVPVCSSNSVQDQICLLEDGDGGCFFLWGDQRNGDAGDIYALRILNNGRKDARWRENGNPIVVEAGSQINARCCIDGENGMIVLWIDDRIGGDFNIWAQRLAPSGELLWGDGAGIPVCNQEDQQRQPKICTDGEGGAFLTWRDDRNMDETNWDIYVQRIDADGNLMWSEADGGIPLCTAEGEQKKPIIIKSEPGSAIIVWEERANRNIYGMRISGADEMERMWEPEQGLPISRAIGDQNQVHLSPDNDGGVFVIWEDKRFGGFPEVDVWAQHINIDGEIQWDENGILVCGAAEEDDEGFFTQFKPVIQPLLNGGCIAVWGDKRSGSTQLYGQCLNVDGEAQWEETGRLLIEGLSQSAMKPQVLCSGHREFVLAWLDGRSSTLGCFPFIQKCIAGENEVLIEYEQHGIPAYTPVVGGGRYPVAILSEDGSTIIIWEDHRRNQADAIYAQKISENGEYLWGETGVKCADFEYDQKLPQLCTDDNGGAILAWRAPTNDSLYNVFCQRISSEGDRLWGEGGIKITENSVDETVEQIIPDGEGGAVILWRACESVFDTDEDLWIQSVNSNGEKLWEDDRENYGKLVCADWNKQYHSKLIRHPDGYVVVWADGRDDELGTPQDDIYGQFIMPDGNYLWEEEGYLICGAERDQPEPDVFVDNQGNIWVAWENGRHGWNQKDIYIQKLNPTLVEDGMPQILLFDEENQPLRDGKAVITASQDQMRVSICHDGNNGAWLAWEDYRGGDWSDIYASHLNPDGEPYDNWDENGNPVSTANHKQDSPQIALLEDHGGSGVVIVWEDKRCSNVEEISNIYCQRIDDDMVSAPEIVMNVPVEFQLFAPYPNPFNSTTTIEYALPFASEVTLNLYNLSGQRVETLVNWRLQAGVHRVMLDAGDMASGLYFLKLEGLGQSVAQKIMLVK